MKEKLISTLKYWSLVSVIIIMASCDGSKNDTLGKLPSLAKECTDDIQKIREQQAQIKDNTKAMEYQKQIVEIKAEAVKNIENAYLNMVKPVELPFIQEGYKGRYTIESIKVTQATYNTIHLEAIATIIDTTIFNFVAYSKFYNSKDEELPGWAALLSNRDSIMDGKVKMTGIYNQLDELIDFKELKTYDNYYYREHEAQNR